MEMGMIKTFGDKATKAIYEGGSPKGVPSDLIRKARIRLNQIAIAAALSDLRNPPSNKLESIKSVPGLYSIRVNQQFRIVFRWSDTGAEDVRFCDYKH
jgi:proteic killer suppression protein